MGQEYQRSSIVQIIQNNPKIVWYENFGGNATRASTDHPFQTVGGTLSGVSNAIASDMGGAVSDFQAFKFGSSWASPGGTVYQEFRHGLRNPLGRYKVKARLGTTTIDDVDFSYLYVQMMCEYHTGVNPRYVTAGVRYYSNYGATEVVQYSVPGGGWNTINEFLWPTFDTPTWREIGFTFDAKNARWIDVTSNNQNVNLREAGYSVLMNDILGGNGTDFSFRTEALIATVGAPKFFYLDEVTIEEL